MITRLCFYLRDRELKTELEQLQHQQVEQARKAYNIAHWSGGYFDINENGGVVVYPQGRRSETVIDLAELISQIDQAGLSFPVLVRFTDIIHQRIDALQSAFQQAIDQNEYRGHYLIAYPIKVNQQRYVVEQMIQHAQGRVGLEVGSKAELIAALITAAQKRITLVCNGYKDREYIRLALLALKSGFTVYIILERMAELTLLTDEAERLGGLSHTSVSACGWLQLAKVNGRTLAGKRLNLVSLLRKFWRSPNA